MEALTEHDRAFLARPLLGFLTTAAGPQPPEPRPVWFEATAAGTLQLFTAPDSLTVRRLGRDPRASLVVAAPVGERESWVSVAGRTTIETDGAPECGSSLVARLRMPRRHSAPWGRAREEPAAAAAHRGRAPPPGAPATRPRSPRSPTVNTVDEPVRIFQDLVAQVPEIVQPIIVMVASAIPFLEGEGAGAIGVVGGIHPVVAGLAAATGNLLSVLAVVLLSSRVRTMATAGRGHPAEPPTEPESKGRRRFRRWLVRFGVPGASILGPLAVPTQFTSAMLVAAGTPRGWVLLWQAVAIVLWTTVATAVAWGVLTAVAG